MDCPGVVLPEKNISCNKHLIAAGEHQMLENLIVQLLVLRLVEGYPAAICNVESDCYCKNMCRVPIGNGT